MEVFNPHEKMPSVEELGFIRTHFVYRALVALELHPVNIPHYIETLQEEYYNAPDATLQRLGIPSPTLRGPFEEHQPIDEALSIRQLVILYYLKNNREMLPNVERILKQYGGTGNASSGQDVLRRELFYKYGPVPELDEVFEDMLKRSTIRIMIAKIYQEYNPSKLSELNEIMAQYRGYEADLLAAVRAKYINKEMWGTSAQSYSQAQNSCFTVVTKAKEQHSKQKEDNHNNGTSTSIFELSPGPKMRESNEEKNQNGEGTRDSTDFFSELSQFLDQEAPDPFKVQTTQVLKEDDPILTDLDVFGAQSAQNSEAQLKTLREALRQQRKINEIVILAGTRHSWIFPHIEEILSRFSGKEDILLELFRSTTVTAELLKQKILNQKVFDSSIPDLLD